VAIDYIPEFKTGCIIRICLTPRPILAAS